jgi:hypothetical protein
LALPVAPVAGAAPAGAASPAVQAANLAEFDFMVATLRDNYAGWDTKIGKAHQAEFDALTAKLRADAAAAADERALLAVMTRWVAYFHDGHTHIGLGPAAKTALAPIQPAGPILAESEVVRELAAEGAGRDPVEGVWLTSGGRYRLAVIRDGGAGRFRAVVLSAEPSAWSPGQIKAELIKAEGRRYTARYRMGDHSARDAEGRLIANGAAFDLGGDLGAWRRVWPTPDPQDIDAIDRLAPSDEMFLKSLSPTTLWLRLPDFGDDRAAPLEALLKAHAAEIEATPNLILDERANGGGSDYVYAPILPLIYTRPIYSIGVELRAGPENIRLRHAVAERIKAEHPDQAAALEAQISLMAQHPGGYVQPGPIPFEVTRFPEARRFPKRVAVLIDGAASTGEQFLLDLRQSRKVTLFGQRNSAGVLDFANVVAEPSPSGRFVLQWATSRSLRLPGGPVDPDGIAPDIRIPADVQDPVTYARDWLERQAD